MKPLPFVWPYALVFWLVFFWAFAPEFGIVRRAQRAQSKTDSKSLQAILFGHSVASFGAFIVAWIPSMQTSHRLAMFVIGTAMIVAGSLLRRHCWRMLGTSFTGDVRARPDQTIIESGAYRWVRHPSYTAGILMNVGIGAALGSWLSIALMILGTVGAYLYRMAVEERMLLAVVGDPYRQFMSTRKRLIPFVY